MQGKTIDDLGEDDSHETQQRAEIHSAEMASGWHCNTPYEENYTPGESLACPGHYRVPFPESNSMRKDKVNREIINREIGGSGNLGWNSKTGSHVRTFTLQKGFIVLHSHVRNSHDI